MQRNRKSIRLKEYDYSQNGYYFVTICTHERRNLFGEIVGADPRVRPLTPVSFAHMILNEFGKIVDEKINELKKYNNVDVDVYCIMPNHIHMIIHIVGAGPRACPIHDVNISGSTQGSTPTKSSPHAKLTPTVGEYIKRLKTLTTRIYIENVNNNHWTSFEKRLFQRNYYERIIRNEAEYLKIKEYIRLNSFMWERDRNNPNNLKSIE